MIQDFRPMAGTLIPSAIRDMVELATRQSAVYTANFNDVRLTVSPGDDPEAAVWYFNWKRDRLYQEWLQSPEYQEFQESERRRKGGQQRRRLMCEGALAVAPENMTLRDEEAWRELLENPGFYGPGLLELTERWARLMEGRIANGDTVAGCAEDAESLADYNDQLSGAAYSRAVLILCSVWAYGEELRQWHNAQFGYEGELANEGSSVIDSSVMRISIG